MAVDKNRIKERLKALYPGVNLSKERIEQLASRLAPKPADDAEDGAIDELINEANFYNPFADIAREDDRLRTLLANQKPTPAPPVPAEPPVTPPTETKTDDTPAWAKTLLEKVERLETEKQQTSIQQKLATRLKDVPAVFYKGRVPKTEEELEAVASEIEADYTAFKQEDASSKLPTGNYTPRGNPGGTTPKEAPKERIDGMLKNMIKI